METQLIEVPETFSVDNERLGRALAHVSAQANQLAAVLTDRQEEQEQRQKQFVEERVALARMESEARMQELVTAINEAYGDPTALERRVDERIHRVLSSLQESSLCHAREMAEAQLAQQEAVHKAMEQKINEALIQVQERAVWRAEQSVQTLVASLSDDHEQLQQSVASDRHLVQSTLQMMQQRVESVGDQTKVAVAEEVDDRFEQVMTKLEERVVRRAENHLMEMIKSLMEENRRQWQRQQLEQQKLAEERLEQRLREVVVVAKKAAETQARGVVAMHAVQDSYEAKTEATMSASIVVRESTVLSAARLEAQQDVSDRALCRAKELMARAARTKRARERRKQTPKAGKLVAKIDKAYKKAAAAEYC